MTLILGAVWGYSIHKNHVFPYAQIGSVKLWLNPTVKTKTKSWPDSAIDIETHPGHRAYFVKSTQNAPAPLIVDLHPWNESYSNDQYALVYQVLEKNWNYIHPDFGGPNDNPKACCSDFAMNDIDLSIDYAIKEASVDTNKIIVLGVSGGGYATLQYSLKTRHKIHQFQAWCPISNLIDFYYQPKGAYGCISEDILKCTGSTREKLNLIECKRRSPLYVLKEQNFNVLNLNMQIFVGVKDPIISITQSVEYYNELVKKMGTEYFKSLVSDKELLEMMNLKENALRHSNDNLLDGQRIVLEKKVNGIRLVVFTGGHDLLKPQAIHEIEKSF